ncbi:MAG: hypothetical protein FJW96_01605 [Actinobacteria bacterium]|nr:hypothetical protein [Actinomycetota bacterium]
MILYRCFAWSRTAAADEPAGPLWFPRAYQSDGRHDNPEAYGALYVSGREVSCVVEQLGPFRGQRLHPSFLRRRGLPLAVAEIELRDGDLVDLDEPAVLAAEGLRPSCVATRRRDVTQPQAAAIHRSHHTAAGIRWWSTFEALWPNVTLFDRAAPLLSLLGVRELSVGDPTVLEAAELLGLS